MLYGYARVSTKQQVKGYSLEEQSAELKSNGCSVVYEEKGYSGKTTIRPVLQELITALNSGDTLMVTKLDRLARNVPEGIALIKSLLQRNIRVHVLNIGMLENTSLGKFFITTLLAVAELERSMIIERTQAGKEVARSKSGFKEGRPSILHSDRVAKAVDLLNTNTYKEVSELTGISKSTLIRAKKKMMEKIS